jgi:hypothetical protein
MMQHRASALMQDARAIVDAGTMVCVMQCMHRCVGLRWLSRLVADRMVNSNASPGFLLELRNRLHHSQCLLMLVHCACSHAQMIC